jgi:hypothetical protein
MKRFLVAAALVAAFAPLSSASGPVPQTPPVKADSQNRAKVTAIFISITLPDGTVQNLSLDPAKTEALFFTERSVTEMLGRFYDQLPERKTLPADQLLKRFGSKQGLVLLNGETSLPLSKESLSTLWTTPNASGVQPALIVKDPWCMPSGEP